MEETLSPEAEGTEEPDIAIKPSPALKAKTESNEENTVPGSAKRTPIEKATAGSDNLDKESNKGKDSTGSGVSAVAEPA